MASEKRVCKICGKEYPYCKTENNTGAYRWQDVCCCREHAAEYFIKIAESRGESPEQEFLDIVATKEDEEVKTVPKKKAPAKQVTKKLNETKSNKEK